MSPTGVTAFLLDEGHPIHMRTHTRTHTPKKHYSLLPFHHDSTIYQYEDLPHCIYRAWRNVEWVHQINAHNLGHMIWDQFTPMFDCDPLYGMPYSFLPLFQNTKNIGDETLLQAKTCPSQIQLGISAALRATTLAISSEHLSVDVSTVVAKVSKCTEVWVRYEVLVKV